MPIERPSNISLEERLARLRSVAEKIYAARPDLQSAFDDVRSDEFWGWIHNFGLREHKEIRYLLIPIPIPEAMAFIGVPKEASFLESGACIYKALHEGVRIAGRTLNDVGSILDFGCGPGRSLRYLLHHADGLSCAGTDIDSAAITWCKQHFPFGDFRTNGEAPPTDWPSGTFGLIYSISVFSHLAEENHLEWLQELRRLIRPDGILLLSVHGEHALRRAMTEEESFQLLNVSRADLDAARRQLDSEHFAFVRQEGGHLNANVYGITFIGKEYVRDRWRREFDVISHRDGALENWQDMVVLRPRA